MKAITLHQPYASLIVEGHKKFETRSWAPPISLLGQRIAIHAAKKNDQNVKDDIAYEFAKYPIGTIRIQHESENLMIPFGAVVGTAILKNAALVQDINSADDSIRVTWTVNSGAQRDGKIPLSEQKHGDFSVGRWIWDFAWPTVYAVPITARGRQGFWDWEPNS